MKPFPFRSLLVPLMLALAPPIPLDHARATESETAAPIPATSTAIFVAIDSHITALKTLAAKGPLGSVHQHAYAVRDLVRALPTHSPTLSPAALAAVGGQIKFVDTLAARLDASGDANDKPGTQANLAKLEAILTSIRRQYIAHKGN